MEAEIRRQPHPHFAEEASHLRETLSIVREEREKAETDLGIVDGNDRLIHVIDDGSDDALVQQFVVRMKLRNLHQLRLSEAQPYFARLDFCPDHNAPVLGFLRGGETSAVYVGRWGVVKTPEYRVCVADWRSPVANLYYSGQVGRVSYDAPDGRVEGELSLKRMFSIESGELQSMQDTGLLGQEKYLTDALSQVTTARLREVVTTIQAEQNAVLRHDPFAPLCVQGVAGSGKTTIALHRVAWILYRLQKEIAAHQLMILAPNPLFLNYISRVLPDLGVDEVRQTTFARLCEKLLGKQMPKVTLSARLEERLGMDKDARDALDGVLRQKGALALGTRLDAFLTDLEQEAPPTQGLMFFERTVLTAEDQRDLYLRQLRHFPLKTRVGEIRKVAATRVKRVAEEVEAVLAKAMDERLSALMRAMPDGGERRARATALIRARDERLAQLKEGQKQSLKQFDAMWPSFALCEVYAEFWRRAAQNEPELTSVADATLPMLCKKRAAQEDLPALLWLGERLYGIARPDVRHVVIDEAQDVSPLQIQMLRKLLGHDSFTLVGDLWQGIYGDEGIRSWKDVSEGIFQREVTVAALSTAYRSTVEITDMAYRVMARHPVEGITAAKPVLRHGQPPCLCEVKTRDQRLERIAQTVRGWQKEGFFSIAVIVKRDNDAQKLHRALQTALPDARLVAGGDESFDGGVMVMGASVVKGLEFDCVLIADADGSAYPDERFYAKLFYVLCTRALHRLRLVGNGGGCIPEGLPLCEDFCKR